MQARPANERAFRGDHAFPSPNGFLVKGGLRQIPARARALNPVVLK